MRNPVKRLAAIHDLSGFGRASLTVVIPVLSTMGIQVCPLPTAVLSTHGKFKGFHFVDLTNQLEKITEHWKFLDVRFDSIYSGYLGAPGQVQIVIDFIKQFSQENQLVVVDPVLGDNGALYNSLKKDMISGMRRLIKLADVITPNLTEVCLLLNREYKSHYELYEIKDYIHGLAEMGPKIVIVTSVPENSSERKTSVIAYNKKNNRFWKVTCHFLPANYPGTGDAFASVVTGSLLQGDSLPVALDRAVQFTSLGVRATFGYDYNPNEGILIEKVLKTLDAPVVMSSYELLD